MPDLVRDKGMGLSDFLALVRAFRSVDPGAVQMETVPVTGARIDGQDVLLLQQSRGRTDLPAAAHVRESRRPPTTVPKIPPSQIAVQVLNGSGVKGVAGTTKAALVAAGFVDGGPVGDADRSDYAQTEVRYVPGAREEGPGRRVLPRRRRQAGRAAGAARPVPRSCVVIGRDFDGVGAARLHPRRLEHDDELDGRSEPGLDARRHGPGDREGPPPGRLRLSL